METRRSWIALDLINFFAADVETGVGPFMATYLAGVRHWNPVQVGMVVATQNIAALIANTPAGWIVDESRKKRWLIAAASLLIALGSAAIAGTAAWPLQLANQAVVGCATALLSSAIVAVSLGVAGKDRLSPSLGRNESFAHGGNVLTALFAGYVGSMLGLQWIFWGCAVLGLLCAGSAFLIRSGEVDDSLARASRVSFEGTSEAVPMQSLVKDRLVLVFAGTVILFHAANSAMLPLAGEELSTLVGNRSAAYMSACIVVAQVVMVPVAYASGRLASGRKRKPILLVSFAALALRGFLFSMTKDPHYMVAIELLDGIGTGISGVLTVLVVADLSAGSGRFNFLGGLMRAALGLGAFCGNLLGGVAAKSFGYAGTFMALSIVPVIGLGLYALFMPETKDIREVSGG